MLTLPFDTRRAAYQYGKKYQMLRPTAKPQGPNFPLPLFQFHLQALDLRILLGQSLPN